MLEELTRNLVLLSLRDRLFVGLASLGVLLLLLSLAGAAAILLLHARADRRDARWARTLSEIEPMVLDVLAGDTPIDRVHATLEPRDRVGFIDFLLDRYAGNLRGDELETVRDLARPFLGLVAARMSHPDPEIRARSVDALATLGMSEYEDLVAQAISDPSPAVALVAARALAEQEGAVYAERILGSLERFDRWSPALISGVLATMGPDAVPAVRDRYLDPGVTPEVRSICADVLRRIGGPAAADLAEQVLGTLGEGTGGGAVPGSEDAAFGGDRELVIESLRILAERGHGRHLGLLRTYIDSPDPVVRAVAVSAVGAIGDGSDRHRLAEAVLDPSRWVAMHAARALRDLRAFAELERIIDEHPERASLAREVIAG